MGRKLRTDSKFIVKLVFLVLTVSFIFSRVVNRGADVHFLELKPLVYLPETWFYFLIAIILAFCNIFIEAVKWRSVVKEFHPVTFNRAVSAVTAGFSFGMFTPNRTGEFIGRISFLPEENRAEGIAASAVLSLTQLSWTIVAGIFALLTLKHELHFIFNEKWPNIFLWSGLILFLIIMLVVVIFKTHLVDHVKVIYNAVRSIRKTSLLRLLILSGLRFLVFTVQFVIIMKLFQVELANGIIAAGAAVFFLLTSAVPSFLFSEIAVRGTVAVVIFSVFGVAVEPVVASSLLLWLINIAGPAVFGLFALIFNNR